MKILLIVVLVLTSYGHCEEAEETSEKYLFGKDNEISQTGTNQNIPNGHGQLLKIPDAQSYQYIKRFPPIYQLQNNPSHVHNNPASMPYQVTYKPYPQTVAKQFTNYANLPQSNYQTSYQMIAPKEPRFFVNSPQIYKKNNVEFGSNIYGSNQYKFNEQYRYKPTTWAGVSNGVINEFIASGNGLETAEGYRPVIAGYGPANAVFGSNNYGSNQYKFAEPYSNKPTAWTEISNRYKNGLYGSGLETGNRYSPVIATYEPASTNGNGFKTVNEYTQAYSGYGISPYTTAYPASNIGAPSTYGPASTNGNGFKTVNGYSPVYSGHGIPSSNGYPGNNIEVASTFVSNRYRNPKMLSYGPTNVGNELKYSNVAQPVQYIKPEYKPVMVSEFESGIVNGALATKTPEFIPYGKPQHMYVVPKEYASTPNVNYGSHGYSRQNFGNSFMYLPKSTNGYSAEYSSVPSFESSLRDIVKMVNEEQRKSNGKAIFLIGKPQIPQQMLSNMAGYSSPSSQQVPLHMLSNLRGYASASSQHGSNINAFSGYKY